MNALYKSKKLLLAFIICVSAIAVSLGTAFAIVFSGQRANAYTPSNQAGNVAEIGEIWTGSTFNAGNLQKLFQMLSNNSSGTIDTLSSKIGSGTINANTLRTYTTNKSNGQSIVVTMGGIDWVVMYLSKTKSNKDDDGDGKGDVIATLWQLDSGVVGNTSFSNGYYDSGNVSSVPSSMYGRSMMRSVTLNNGGPYWNGTSNGNNSTVLAEDPGIQDDHVYGSFTSPNSPLREFIVQPRFVSWQESGQNAKTQIGFSYNLSNENWSSSIPDTNFYNAGMNFAELAGNDAWKNDYLWLPSMSETGHSSSYTGIWGTNQNERSNGSGTYAWSRSSSVSF